MVQKVSFLKKEFFFSQETAFTIFFYPKFRASKYLGHLHREHSQDLLNK